MLSPLKEFLKIINLLKTIISNIQKLDIRRYTLKPKISKGFQEYMNSQFK